MAGSFNRGAFEASAFDVEDLAALAADQSVAVPTQTFEATVEVVAIGDATVTATNTTVAGPIVAAEADQEVRVVVQVGDIDNPVYGSAAQDIAIPSQTATGEVIPLSLAEAAQTIAAPSQTAESGVEVHIDDTGAFSAAAFQGGAFYVAAAGAEIAIPTQVAEVTVGTALDAAQTIAVPSQAATVDVGVAAEASQTIAVPSQTAEVLALPGFFSSTQIAVAAQTATANVEVSAASSTTATLTPSETATVLVQAQSAITIAVPINTAKFVQLKLRPDFTARAPERPLYVVQVQRPLFHVKDARRPFEARLPI